MRHPTKNSCIGHVCGLTAPEEEMVAFVAKNHSLSMWAYASGSDDRASDDTIADRGVLAVMLVLWSVAINCVGPLLGEFLSFLVLVN